MTNGGRFFDYIIQGEERKGRRGIGKGEGEEGNRDRKGRTGKRKERKGKLREKIERDKLLQR